MSLRNYDTWLEPRERRTRFEVHCENCGETFESDGTWNEAYGVDLENQTCPNCGEENVTVTGEAEPPEPDYDAYREAQLEDRYDR